MISLNQVDNFRSTSSKVCQDPDESVKMECGRLIHAAIISQRFLKMLLTNPIKSIEDGFCGEKFAFTHEEKQHIKRIQALTLAEFSNQLIQAVELSTRISAASEMAYVRSEAHEGLPA